MIDERHMPAEGMKAAMGAQRNMPPFDYVKSLGNLTSPQDAPVRQRQYYNGTVGILAVGRLKNIIGVMKANGYHIDLWLGHGWLGKPYTITAFPEDIKIVERNLANQ